MSSLVLQAGATLSTTNTFYVLFNVFKHQEPESEIIRQYDATMNDACIYIKLK